METFEIKGDYIQLNQLLKAMAWCMNGGEASEIISEGLVKVNGVVEYRKRNKIVAGSEVEFNNLKVMIT